MPICSCAPAAVQHQISCYLECEQLDCWLLFIYKQTKSTHTKSETKRKNFSALNVRSKKMIKKSSKERSVTHSPSSSLRLLLCLLHFLLNAVSQTASLSDLFGRVTHNTRLFFIHSMLFILFTNADDYRVILLHMILLNFLPVSLFFCVSSLSPIASRY